MTSTKILFAILLTCSGLAVMGQDTAFQRILKLKDDTAKARDLIDHGRELLDRNNEAAAVVFDRSRILSDKLGYVKGLGQSLMGIGYVYAQKGSYPEAIDAYQKAAIALRKANLINRATECMNVIATIHDFLGRRDSAIRIYMESARLLENSPYLSSLGSTYSYIGVLHNNANDHKKAIFYLTRAVEILRRAKDTVYLVEALTELGDTYANTRNVKMGLPLAYEALELAKYVNRDNSDGSVPATAYYTLAALHLVQGKLDSATYEASQCVKYSLESGDMNTYITGAIVLSDCHEKAGNQAARVEVLQKAIEQAKRAGNVVLLQDLFERLADASFKIGDFKEAYGYHKEYEVYKDSLFNQKNQATISELEVKYQTSKKEEALSRNQLELERSRQMIYSSLGGLVIALLFIGLLYYVYQNKKKSHRTEIQAFKQEKEIHMLQALMQGEEKERTRIAKDLHDGVAGMLAAVKMHFSTIEDVDKAFVLTEGYQQGMNLLNQATQEIRKTSHNLMPEVLMQHGLDEALNRYCNNLNNSRTLQIQYDSWGSIDRFNDGFELSVYRIVQELLNNIVKHSKASQAIVQLSQQDDILSISIEDNGVGFVAEQAVSDGMGLKSLKSRIKAMNGKIEMHTADQSGVSAYLEFEVAELKKRVKIQA